MSNLKRATMKYLEQLNKFPNEFEYYLGANLDEITFAEKQLNVSFPKNYRQFLSECGMCNFGDTKIDGIFKTEDETYYSVVENTLRLRKLGGLSNDLIVLDFEEEEYLTLYKVSENLNNEDNYVYGAEVRYENNEEIKIGKLIKIFDSFEDFFQNFIELAD